MGKLVEMKARQGVLALLLIGVACAAASAAQAQCGSTDLLLDGIKSGDVAVQCNTILAKDTIVPARIIIEAEQASNLTLDCNGGRIESPSAQAMLIRSKLLPNGTWSVPRRIVIKNCTIVGGVRVIGLGQNGEAAAVRTSSHNLSHTSDAQKAAPTDIRFERVVFQGKGAIPLYIAPGATHVTVSQSKFTGHSNSTAVYLDAESAFNQITNSSFHTNTSRELIAIDGSAHNSIDNNYFSSLSKGGVFVYRNCGEGGTVRHQEPEFNTIAGNTFYYNKYAGFNPAIWFGSRDGWSGGRTYCSLDKGYPFGSSVDDRGFANNNIAQNNLFIARSPKWLIRDNGQGNQITDNRQE